MVPRKMLGEPKRVQPSRDTDLKAENKHACSYGVMSRLAPYPGGAVKLGGRDWRRVG